MRRKNCFFVGVEVKGNIRVTYCMFLDNIAERWNELVLNKYMFDTGLKPVKPSCM